MPPLAVVLLSGGIDSAVAAACAWADRYEVHALTVDYGQRHAAEVGAARSLAASLHLASHRVVAVDLASFGGSVLTNPAAPVPKDRSPEEMAAVIPPTYVPARNTVLLALGLSLAESIGSQDLYVGVNEVDYSGYPDCRPEFLRAFEQVAAVGTRAGIEGDVFRVHAPLIRLTKAEIIVRGVELGVDLALTHSCYDPDREGRACGRCDSCILRKKGFAEAAIPDPTVYVP